MVVVPVSVRATAATAEGAIGEGNESYCSIVDLMEEDKEASRMTRLMEESSRMESTSWSSPTLMASSGCDVASGHP